MWFSVDLQTFTDVSVRPVASITVVDLLVQCNIRTVDNLNQTLVNVSKPAYCTNTSIVNKNIKHRILYTFIWNNFRCGQLLSNLITDTAALTNATKFKNRTEKRLVSYCSCQVL